MSRKTKYARKGEFVRILTPILFERCGYPLCVKDIMRYRQNDIEAEVLKIIQVLKKKKDDDIFVDYNISGRVHGMLVAAIATHMPHEADFGGNERKIIENEDKWIDIKEPWLVVDKNFVKTGIRYAPSSWICSYSGEYDYEPGGLKNEKTHCIYTLVKDNLRIKIQAIYCEREI